MLANAQACLPLVNAYACWLLLKTVSYPVVLVESLSTPWLISHHKEKEEGVGLILLPWAMIRSPLEICLIDISTYSGGRAKGSIKKEGREKK